MERDLREVIGKNTEYPVPLFLSLYFFLYEINVVRFPNLSFVNKCFKRHFN